MNICAAFTVLLLVSIPGHVSGEKDEGAGKRYLFSGTTGYIWGTWSEFSACSPSCHNGMKARTRHCMKGGQEADNKYCGSRTMLFTKCTSSDCPSTGSTSTSSPHGVGTWSHWSSYSHCSVTCGSGTMHRTRHCQGAGSFYCLGHSSETRQCHYSCSAATTAQTKVDGHWSSWATLSHCSRTCGHGTYTRQRYCNHPAPSGGGHTCSGHSTTVVYCQLRSCVVNGGWSSWQSWSTCSQSCGLGTLTRTRSCSHPVPSNGGATCHGDSKETHECSSGPCPTWSHWFEAACSVSCGSGTKERLRHCSTGRDADCTGKAYEVVPCSGVKCV